MHPYQKCKCCFINRSAGKIASCIVYSGYFKELGTRESSEFFCWIDNYEV